MVFEFDHQRKNVILWIAEQDTDENINRVCDLYHDSPYRVIVMRSGTADILFSAKALLKHNCMLPDKTMA